MAVRGLMSFTVAIAGFVVSADGGEPIRAAALGPGARLDAGAGDVRATLCAGPTADFAALTAFFEGNPQFFPNGVGMLLIRDGEVIYERAFHGFDPDEVIPIASSTKWISGLLILEQHARGLVDIDGPISDWVPAFDRADKRDITLVEAFAHASGLPGSPAPHRRPELTMAAAVSAIAAVPLDAAPGEELSYGGLGMQAAAYATALAAGADWSSLAASTLFDPLAMDGTDYDAFTPPELVPTANPNAAGSVRTSLRDYARFLTMLDQGGVFGGERVVATSATRALRADLLGPGVPIARSPYQTYEPFAPGVGSFRTGFGCFIDPAGLDASGTARWATSAGAFGTNAFIDLDRNVTGVMMTYNDERWFGPAGPYNPATRAFLEFVRPLVESALPTGVGPENLGDIDGDGGLTQVDVWLWEALPTDIDGDTDADACDRALLSRAVNWAGTE